MSDMKFKLKTAALLLCAAAAAFSCKKDKKEEYNYVEGNIIFNAPAFVARNETIHVTPKGAIHPKGGVPGYYWRISELMEKSDTTRLENGSGDGSFTFNMGDKLGVYTLSCYAFAKGYYPISSTSYITVVQPGHGKNASITGVETTGAEVFTDPRDGIEYDVVEVAGKKWMRNNLAFSWDNGKAPEERDTLGMGFKGYDIMSNVFGRFYSWNEAMKACPEGWHLPTDREWLEAAQSVTNAALSEHEVWAGVSGAFMAYAKFTGEDLWEFWPEVDVTDKTKLAALPFGYANLESEVFNGLYEFAAFWTADELDGEQGYYRYIYADKADFYPGAGHKSSFGANVRCVKD